MSGFALDLRFALRSLLRNPAFSLAALAALALGIGASTAVFSVLYSVALRPLPWPGADRIVAFSEINPDLPETRGRGGFSLSNIREWREKSESVEAMGAYWNNLYTLTGGDEPRRLQGSRVTPDLFRVLRVSPELGRVFTQDEVERGESKLAVLSGPAFRRYLAGDPGRIGGTLRLDGELYTLIGVMPDGFDFPEADTDLWVPLVWQDSGGPHEEREIALPVVGRLADGFTVAQAQDEGQRLLTAINESREERRRARAASRSGEPGDEGEGGGPGERRIIRRQGPPGAGPPGAEGADAAGGHAVRRVVRGPGGEPPEGGPGGERVVRHVVQGPVGPPGEGDGSPSEDGVVRRVVRGPGGGSGQDEAAPAGERLVRREAQGPGADDQRREERAVGAGAGDAGGPGPARERREGPPPRRTQLQLETLQDRMVAPFRPALRVLAGSVLLVFLIACANVANLLLVRGVHRQRELATRAALGAGRGGLTRSLLAESALLSLVGGAFGVALAWGGVRLVVGLDPGRIPRMDEVALHPAVLLFALGLVALSATLFGLVPMVQTSLPRLTSMLGREGGPMLGRASFQSVVRGVLVVLEVALALMLLIGAGLLANSFVRLTTVDTGFDSNGVLTAYVAAPVADYPPGPARTQLFEGLLERVRTIPGVRGAGMVNFLPPVQARVVLSFLIEGQPRPTDPSQVPTADLRIVTPGYFETMGIPVRAGRAFADSDRDSGPPVVMVNEALARRHFPDGRVIGERLAQFGEIVGVVGDVRAQGFDSEEKPTFYVSLAQAPPPMAPLFNRMALAVKTPDPDGAAAAVRTQLESIDPDLALDDVQTMSHRLAESVSLPRFNAAVMGVFAALALLLAVLGLYGLMSYAVSRQVRETGVRMALGAPRRQVLARAVWGGLRLTLVGVALGIGGALMLQRLVKGMLFGIAATDPATFAVLAVVLLITATAACLVPARRAAAIDPSSALRHE